MRFNQFFAALMVLAAMVIPAVADEVDDLILDLKYGTEVVRNDAARILGEIGDQRAVDPLIDALEDENEIWIIRELAAMALGEIGDPRAINPLIDALKDEESLVRTAAAEALDMMVGVAECQWDSYTPDQTAFVGQPGDVFPLRNSPFKAGSYIVLVGPAGEDGLDLPPATWNAFGPYELKGGHKYKAMIESPLGESLRFEEDLADLLSYSDPSPESASVYARNNCPGDVWYAICLRPTKLEGGTAAETEDEWIDDECLQMGEPFDACQCLYIKAKDLIKAGEYDKAIQLLNYIIEVVTPIHNDRVAQGFPFSNSAQQLVANSWFFKGDALSQQGRYGEAIQAYDEAIELDPGSWSDPLNPPKYYLYWVAKGDALENLGRNSEAQQCFDESDRIKQAWGWE